MMVLLMVMEHSLATTDLKLLGIGNRDILNHLEKKKPDFKINKNYIHNSFPLFYSLKIYTNLLYLNLFFTYLTIFLLKNFQNKKLINYMD